MEFNPRSAQFRANPYPIYHRLRAQDPVHYREEQGDWILTRYADMVALLTDDRIGYLDRVEQEQDETEHNPPNQAVSKFLHLRQESQRLKKLWINVKNPPTHTRLHKLFQPAFTLHKVNALRPRIQMMADELIDQAQAAGKLDIMHDLASPLTSGVISQILGIPEKDRMRLMRWSHHLGIGIDLDMTLATYERGVLALIGFTQYFRKLMAKLRRDPHPEDNFLSTMIQAQAEGELSEDELLANSILLFLTSHSTSQHLIGNGMLALLRHPHQLRLLQADPARIKTTIDECLRYDCPAQVISRTALADVERSGKTIQKGQTINFVLGAANRDPAQFPEPDKFDICRQPNRYLSFGRGMHYCFGARLARLVAQIGVGTLVRRLPRIALSDQAPQWEESFLIHGLKTLPVVF